MLCKVAQVLLRLEEVGPDKTILVRKARCNSEELHGVCAYNKAGGNGTAGTATAVPVFEGEKWCRLDSNSACVIEWPLRAVRRSLGRLRGLLRTFSSLQASKVQKLQVGRF